MAAAAFCVVARERAPNIAVLPEKSGQNLGNLFPRRFRPAGAGVAVSPRRQKTLLQTSLLTDIMVPISDGVSLVKDWTGLPHEKVVNLVAQWILKTDLRVETFGEDEIWARIDDEQRDKTRIEDGKIEIDDGSKIVRLTFIDGVGESSHPDRISAATKTTAKAGTEATVSWLGLSDLVEKYIKAGVIKEGNAQSPAGAKRGRKPIYDRPEIDVEFGMSLFGDGLPPDNNISELARRVWKRLEAKYGYVPEEMPQRTEMKKRAGVWMRAVLEEIEGGGS